MTNCDIWYIRFCLDRLYETLVLGNQVGKIYMWDLTGDDPSRGKPHLLTHSKCTAAIRQVTVSRDGKYAPNRYLPKAHRLSLHTHTHIYFSMLLSVTDAGTVWRWDRRETKK